MADKAMELSGFKEIDAMLQRLEQGPEIEALQRKALRAAGAVIKAELRAVTPVRETKGRGKRALPIGAMKAAIRSRVSVPADGSAPSVTVDFGKLTYLAHIVDIGHVDFKSGGRTHTPAHPFVRGADEASHDRAAAAYVETLRAGVREIMNGGKSGD